MRDARSMPMPVICPHYRVVVRDPFLVESASLQFPRVRAGKVISGRPIDRDVLAGQAGYSLSGTRAGITEGDVQKCGPMDEPSSERGVVHDVFSRVE